jgi:hypothetical protein
MLKKNPSFRRINCVLVLTPVIILLVTSVVAQNYLIPSVQGQAPSETAASVNETGTTSSVEPLIVITSPTNSSQIPVGKVVVSGNASDAAAANIKTIGVKIDEGDYVDATPSTPGDWSIWSITLDTAAPGPHTLKARADYGAGEQTWSIGNVLVNAISNAQGTSNTTSTPPMSGGNSSQQQSVEIPEESASESQISETSPQIPSTQQAVQTGSVDNQETQTAAANYKNPIDILLGRG